ncbi:MAG: Hsp20/alpha crystallin family protein [Pseudanabaenaceae cyanobacterium]
MALIRWSPFREIDALQREMNRLFDSLTADVPALTEGGFFSPAAEMHETADAIHLKLEVPGINPNDLDIQVSAEAISITGERKSESTTEDKGVRRSEFRYGRFQRVFQLPARIQNDQVKADYRDGILSITLPKAEAEKTRVVKVNVGTTTEATSTTA